MARTRQKKANTIDYWKTVLFTDESKIKVDGSDGRVFVAQINRRMVTLLYDWYCEERRNVTDGVG